MQLSRAVRKNRLFQTAGIVAMLLLMLISMPVVLPYVAVSESLQKRRMITAAEVTRCKQCGRLLTRRSLELANQKVSTERAELRAKHPKTRFRIVRNLWAICTHCFAEYDWNERETAFVQLELNSHPV
jgi:hypothetical protein